MVTSPADSLREPSDMTQAYRTQPEFLLKSDNPDATITSDFKGMPSGFAHNLPEGVARAIEVSHYQSAEDAWKDIPKHKELFLGDTMLATITIDDFGNPGIKTRQEFAIRHPNTIRSLLPSSGHPRYQSAEPCHLTDDYILDMFFSSVEQGVEWSWTIVKPTFDDEVGMYLVFCPSHMALYMAAAVDKLGTCVDPHEFSEQNRFNPTVIHVAMPWLSDQEFRGVHTILIGTGHRRQLIVNGGIYDGGTKKPVTFNVHNRRLPRRSSRICTHMAVGQMLNGRRGAWGNTTAAGKSENITNEDTLPKPFTLVFDGMGEEVVEVDLSPDGSLRRPEYLTEEKRLAISDDISVLVAGWDGVYAGEAEAVTFYRTDLSTQPGDLPYIDACAAGEVEGRIYWYNHGMNEEGTRFLPWSHETLTGPTRNPRVSFPVASNKEVIPSGPDNMQKVDFLAVAIPVPDLPDGFHIPPLVKVSVRQYFTHCLHGARKNKGNPALGALGEGAWMFEGYLGKMGFTLDSTANCLARDFKFWESLPDDLPCFLVFNYGSSSFRYSGTLFARALLESWWDEVMAAPLIDLPGTFSGGVPDLATFLPDGAVSPALWDPRLRDQAQLEKSCRMLDSFVFRAANSLLREKGLHEHAEQVINTICRRYIEGLSRKP